MKKKFIYNQQEIEVVAKELVNLMDICQVFTFSGPLGAGKTSLIQAMLIERGVTVPVSSPTFTYLNVYENNANQLFYHFDLYRLTSVEEFLSAGFDEYLFAPNSWTFIEWPEIIMPLLQKKVCFCQLAYYDIKRELTITIS